MITKNGTSSYVATCDRCGEVIKNIYVWEGKVYGSSCILPVMNAGMYANAPLARKPSWIRAESPEVSLEIIEEHRQRQGVK